MMMIPFRSWKRRSTSKVHMQFCPSQFITVFVLSFTILVIFKVCLIVILGSVPIFCKIVFDSNFIKVTFGSRKILRKEKKCKENDFFMFGYPMKNIKENQI